MSALVPKRQTGSFRVDHCCNVFNDSLPSSLLPSPLYHQHRYISIFNNLVCNNGELRLTKPIQRRRTQVILLSR